MGLHHLSIAMLRNICQATLTPSPGINVFCGQNGSGKTSVLEAIYVLGFGRSFRTSHFGQMINVQADKLNINAKILHHQDKIQTSVGLERTRTGPIRLQVAGDRVQSIAEMARLLPIQLLNLKSYQLLHDSAEQRRRLLDWGVFHVEHTFLSLWKRCRRLLKQRNAALRQQANRSLITSWDDEFVQTSLAMDKARDQFTSQWITQAQMMIRDLLGIKDIQIRYTPGWDTSSNLQTILAMTLEHDRRLGFTQWGAQRADIKVFVKKTPAHYHLSQGQIKGVMSLLQLTQAAVVMTVTEKHCVFLIDDLLSELDSTIRGQVIEFIGQLKTQVFLTCIEKDSIDLPASSTPQWFHVEHGQVEAI